MNKNKKNNKQPTKANKSSKQKRWFVGVSGWGLSLNAGSDNASMALKKRSYPLSQDSRTFLTSGIIAAASVLDNTLYTCNVCSGITQGTSDLQRLGDFIHIETVCFKGGLDTSYGTSVLQAVGLRVLLVASREQFTATNFTSGLGSSNIFMNGSSGNFLNEFCDPKKVKVLCDEIFHIQTLTTVGTIQQFSTSCKIDSSFEYQTGTAYGTAANLYWVMIPVISGGTSGVTTAGTFTYDVVTTFRDTF